MEGKDGDARTQPTEHSIQILNLDMDRKSSFLLPNANTKVYNKNVQGAQMPPIKIYFNKI